MDRLLNDSRMARRLGVTRAWLVQQAINHQVPHLRAGKRFLFNPEAVESALADQAAAPPQRESSVSDAEEEAADA